MSVRSFVPRTIYRTWKTSDLREYQAAWNFTQLSQRFRNHSVFGSGVWEAFLRINHMYPAAKADIFRYSIIYEYGGIYLDVKSAIRKLNDTRMRDVHVSPWALTSFFRLTSMAVLGSWIGEMQQWWFAAPARSQAIKLVLQSVVRNVRLYRHRGSARKCAQYREVLPYNQLSGILFFLPARSSMDVLNTTGPYAFTRALVRNANVTIDGPDGNGRFIYDFLNNHRYGKEYFQRTYWNIGEPLVI